MTENEITFIQKAEAGGHISYSEDVIAVIAGLAATEIEGVAGMSGGITSGIVELLGKKNLTKGVKAEIGNEEAAIDLNIAVSYGCAIHEVSRKVQENVKRAVEGMTGLHVVEVNVNIVGVNVGENAPAPNRVK